MRVERITCLAIGLIPLPYFTATHPIIVRVMAPRREFGDPLPKEVHNARRGYSLRYGFYGRNRSKDGNVFVLRRSPGNGTIHESAGTRRIESW